MGILGMIFDFASYAVKEIWDAFLNAIDAFDAILIIIVVYKLMTISFHWGKGWSIFLGVIVAAVGFVIFSHHIGFWIISIIFSCVWALAATFIALFPIYLLSDPLAYSVEVWMLCVPAVIAFAFTMNLHFHARQRIREEDYVLEKKRQEREEEYLRYNPQVQEMQPIDKKSLGIAEHKTTTNY